MNELQINEDIMSAFEKRDIDLLARLLESYPLDANENLRFRAHYVAKKYLIAGDLQKSFSTLVEALKDYGPHVCLLADAVGVAYLINDIRQMDYYFQSLLSEFAKTKNALSEITLIRVKIFVGKIYELRGEIYEAEKNYQEAFDASRGTTYFLSSCAQLVRVKSFLSKGDEVNELYNLLMFKKNDFNESDFELNHAMLLMEARLFGSEVAGHRINKIIDSHLPSYDKKQMICHFLEELLWNNESLSKNLLTKIVKANLFTELNNYERVVFSSFFKEIEKTIVDTNNSILDEMKCLILLIKLELDSCKKESYRKKLIFILKGLSKESRILLEKKWQNLIFPKQSLVIVLDTKKEEVQIENVILNRAKSKQLFKILIHFKDKKNVESDRLTYSLFEITNYDESSYHRLRMVISRLNQELKESCGIAKFFTLRFHQLELGHDAKIIIS